MLSVNQDSIVDIEVSGFFNVKDACFVVYLFEDVVDVVVYCTYSVEPFFYSGEGEFIGVV